MSNTDELQPQKLPSIRQAMARNPRGRECSICATDVGQALPGIVACVCPACCHNQAVAASQGRVEFKDAAEGKKCIDCGQPIGHVHNRTQRCGLCQQKHRKATVKAAVARKRALADVTVIS